jgi:hypothetical protein
LIARHSPIKWATFIAKPFAVSLSPFHNQLFLFCQILHATVVTVPATYRFVPAYIKKYSFHYRSHNVASNRG